MTLIYSIAIGLSAAATAMVSRRIGEGDREAAAKAGAQVILIALVLSVLIAVPGYIFAEDILRAMARDQSVADVGTQFTRLMLTCNLPILLLWMLNGIFRGAGDAATAMRALWIANAVNIVLCPLFIFGWGPVPAFGVLGSGIATTIGRSTGVLYQLWNLFEVGKIVRIKMQHLRPQWEIILRLLKISAGSTGQYLIASASWIFMIYILGQISKEVTAGYTIAIRIVIFALLPAWGMSNAAATWPRRRRPASVSSLRLAVRLNSATPSDCSSARIWRVTAGCDRPSSPAAAVKLPRRAAASNTTSRCSRSTRRATALTIGRSRRDHRRACREVMPGHHE